MSSPVWHYRRRGVRARIEARRQRRIEALLTGAGSVASSREAFEAYNAALVERFAHARQRWILGVEDFLGANEALAAAEDWMRVRPVWGLPEGARTTFVTIDETREWTTPVDPAVARHLHADRMAQGLWQMSTASWGVAQPKPAERLHLDSWSAAPGLSEDQDDAGQEERGDRG